MNETWQERRARTIREVLRWSNADRDELLDAVLRGAPEIDVESDYDAEFDIGLDATPRECEFVEAGRYKLVRWRR